MQLMMSHITRWRLVGTIIWTLVPLYILLSFAHWLAPDSLDEYSAFTPFLALVCLQAYYISRKHKFSANWSGFNPTAGIGSTLHFWIRAQFVPSIPLAIMHATTLTALYRTLYSIPSTQGLCLHEHHILLHTVSWIYAAFNTEALLFVFPRLHRTRWQRVRQILPQCIKTSLTRTGPVLVLAYVTHVLLAPLLVSLLTYIAHSLGWYAHHCSAPVTTDTDTDFRSSMTEVCTVTEGASVTEFSEQSVGPWLSNLTLLDAVLPKLVLVTLLCAFIESYLYQLTQIIFTEPLSLSADSSLAPLLHTLQAADPQQRQQGLLALVDLVQFVPHTRHVIFADQTGRTWQLVHDATSSTLTTFNARLDTLLTRVSAAQSLDQGTKSRLATWPIAQQLSQACLQQYLFQDMQQCMWSARALSQLIQSSSVEDRLGLVTSSLAVPDTLSTLLHTWSLLNRFCQLLPHLYHVNTALHGHLLSAVQPNALLQEITTSIYTITTTFYENLELYNFSPAHASILQDFVNFVQ